MTPQDISTSGRRNGLDWDTLPYGGDLFGELHLAEPDEPVDRPVPDRLAVLPGLAICGVASAAAAWLAEHYDFPIILLGLLVGLSLNFVARDTRTHAGLDIASRTGLRWGIVLLGLQVTLAQIVALGTAPFLALLVVMAATIMAGILGARGSGQGVYSGLLAGGATAICGASAALALYGVIGRTRLSQAQFALTLVGISLASAVAMSVYPVLASVLHLSDAQAGFLMGASIHDVAQAIGGGYAFSDTAGSYATIVKLARVTLLAPVIVIVSLAIGRVDAEEDAPVWKRLSLPWFILAFLGAVALGSAFPLPKDVVETALACSKGLLLAAVTATAMRSRMDLLMEMGWRATIPVVTATVVSFLATLSFVLLYL